MKTTPATTTTSQLHTTTPGLELERQQTTCKQPALECSAPSNQQHASNQPHIMQTFSCPHAQRIRSQSETCALNKCSLAAAHQHEPTQTHTVHTQASAHTATAASHVGSLRCRMQADRDHTMRAAFWVICAARAFESEIRDAHVQTVIAGTAGNRRVSWISLLGQHVSWGMQQTKSTCARHGLQVPFQINVHSNCNTTNIWQWCDSCRNTGTKHSSDYQQTACRQ